MHYNIYMQQVTNSKPKPVPMTVDDFSIKHRLGKGAYGDVYLTVKKSDQNQYAMKQIAKRKLEKQGKQYQALVQKQLLKSFKHPGIVTLKYSFHDKKMLYFVLEYCEGGDFIQFIRLNIDKLCQPIKVFYIAQIVNVLEYLHRNGVTHRDLKPQNLLLDSRGYLKLIDFGTAEFSNSKLISQEFKDNINSMKQKADDEQQVEVNPQPSEDDLTTSPKKKQRRSTFVGTCYYISPELLEENYCPHSADLWALGCIIYQLYYLETPFKDNYEFAVFEKIKKAELSFPKNQFITEQAIDLIKKLLVKNPDKRLGSAATEELSFKVLKSHPFFNGVNVDTIFSQEVPELRDLKEPELPKQQQQFKEQKIIRSRTGLMKLMNQEISDTSKILIHGAVEKKNFISYTCYYLVVYQGLHITRIKSEDTERRKQLIINLHTNSLPAKFVNQSKFQLNTVEKTYIFKSDMASKWVAILNGEFLKLKKIE